MLADICVTNSLSQLDLWSGVCKPRLAEVKLESERVLLVTWTHPGNRSFGEDSGHKGKMLPMLKEVEINGKEACLVRTVLLLRIAHSECFPSPPFI